MFRTQAEKDKTDTTELTRLTCDSLKADKEHFLTIYNNLKS
jgi:hypothetical protein